MLGVRRRFRATPRASSSGTTSPATIFDSDLMTLSGNVIAPVPLSVTGYSLRPYAIGGLGLIHSGITYPTAGYRERR